MFVRSALCAVVGWSLVTSNAWAQAPSPKISFRKTVLDTIFRSEGAAVGDFNKDGRADIAAGFVWYEQPVSGDASGKWTMHPIGEKAPEYNPLGYSNSFCTFAEDLNGDGWSDILVVDFPGTPTWWFENPRKPDAPWPKHTLTPVTNNESPQFLDVDGDGQRDLLAAYSPDPKAFDGPERRMGFMTRTSNITQPWTIRPVSLPAAASTTRYSHGLGLGDINGDKRQDIVVPQGWWEAPAESSQSEWTFHAAPLGQNCAQMYVYDYDGDGDADVLSTSSHAVGLWWHEQLPEGKWKTHTIDTSFSQTHALCQADINGDGLPDFVTGKRWWAHGPKGDVDPDKPAVLYWFELRRDNGKAGWVANLIDHDSGVGTQFEVADLSGDKLLDIAISNKKGVFYFQQMRE
ncbi:MAG: VCBS repeat-containing protein [Pirellulaceae bacterium]|nr:VCBS repeat-containing protein [Pirellulaceae bacterium]